MFYHPDVGGDPVELTLPGCEAPCPMDHWATLTKSLTLDMETWTRECQEGQRLIQSVARIVSYSQSDAAFIILLVGLLCLVLIILPVTFTASRCRRNRDYSSIWNFLLSCALFFQNKRFVIYLKYFTVSYVWKGQVYETCHRIFFNFRTIKIGKEKLPRNKTWLN